MINVLVTGANGQLGLCIKDLERNYTDLNFIYTDYEDLDITDLNQVNQFFEIHKPIHYCVNCAAYTAVDKAEEEPELAFKINAEGPKNLAMACLENKATLIQISTDFVFDGTTTTPYKESDLPNPISTYGASKWEGEKHIQAILAKQFIIRTSWLYSPYGSNFVKTMLHLAETKTELNVVNDQIGTPTNAYDLAEAIIHIISKHMLLEQNNELKKLYGTYHFSNEGACSWYDFAKKIFSINKINIDLQPIPSSSYPTPAKRPVYSVLDKSKIKHVFGVNIQSWEQSLKNCISV
ncbi:MAG: dTDP-4-dehydrorhamnose reductase [Tamlana sp.]